MGRNVFGVQFQVKMNRKFNFKMLGNIQETFMERTGKLPTDKDECTSLSLLHCCHSVKGNHC
jgi:hypothetical protein